MSASPASVTSSRPILSGRVLLVHGYSASGKDLEAWRTALTAAGINTTPIVIGNYVTLNNEVTIKDLGEAFDRALRLTQWSDGTRDDTFTFDAIVHSTGMLVLRQWLTADPFLGTDDPRSRIRRLKHLVGLAPATFGSPQAAKGRSWLGALIKGTKQLGPDFLNAGDRVLAGLEIASSYTWDLAQKDMIDNVLYDKGPNTPYVTIFIGNQPYSGLSALSNSPGCDGTVRWAGCGLNTRKVRVDFRRNPKLLDKNGNLIVDPNGNPARYDMSPWADSRLAAPMIAVDGQNHGTIVSAPDPTVRDLIVQFLQVTDADSYDGWQGAANTFGAKASPLMDQKSAYTTDDGTPGGGAGWQQILVHMVDDHGDPVTDYNLQLYIGDSLDQSNPPPGDATEPKPITPVQVIADTYSLDNSYRCFYMRLSPRMLNLNKPGTPPQKMWIELIASSGSDMIQYEAYTGDSSVPPQSLTVDGLGVPPVKLDITALAQQTDSLLFAYTSTMLEVFVEREPTPLNDISTIFNFIQ